MRVGWRAERMRRLLRSTEQLERLARWRTWADGSFVASLDSLQEASTRLGTKHPLFRRNRISDIERAKCQAGLTTALRKSDTPVAMRHVRRRLERWQIDLLPGHRVSRWLKGIHTLATLVPPRVVFARVNVALNGWRTARRFQKPTYVQPGDQGHWD